MAQAFATDTPRAFATSAALKVSPSKFAANSSPRAMFARRLLSSVLRSRLRERTSIMCSSFSTTSGVSSPFRAARIAATSVIPLFSAMITFFLPCGVCGDYLLLSPFWHLPSYQMAPSVSRTFCFFTILSQSVDLMCSGSWILLAFRFPLDNYYYTLLLADYKNFFLALLFRYFSFTKTNLWPGVMEIAAGFSFRRIVKILWRLDVCSCFSVAGVVKSRPDPAISIAPAISAWLTKANFFIDTEKPACAGFSARKRAKPCSVHAKRGGGKLASQNQFPFSCDASNKQS